ncbi:MAG: hypothetical protein K6D96_10670 [Acetatifactor sp.]|nr:hypothetical protein [Acetatifactor sp.]
MDGKKSKISVYIYICIFIAILFMGTVLNVKNIPKAVTGGDYTDGFFGRYTFVEINGRITKKLGIKEMNERLLLDSGDSLVNPMYGNVWLFDNVEKTVDLSRKLSDKNIPFLYVQVPYEIDMNDDEPILKTEHSDDVANEFLQRIRAEGVECLDLRAYIATEYPDYYEAFFRTDHHWKSETAFSAMGWISEYMEDRIFHESVPGEYKDPASYETEIIEDSFLGANGRRTGKNYAGLDDFTVLTPKFETSLTLCDDNGELKTGSFDEVLLYREYLDSDSLYENSMYDVYTGLDRDYFKIINNEPVIDKKIFVVKDSFSRPVIAFMSTIYREIVAVDVRYNDPEKESLYEIIDREDPDVVLMMYNPYMLGTEEGFDFE